MIKFFFLTIYKEIESFILIHKKMQFIQILLFLLSIYFTKERRFLTNVIDTDKNMISMKGEQTTKIQCEPEVPKRIII